jgi:heparan sulfate N-deacetylase/N-sulfotransferase NDST2
MFRSKCEFLPCVQDHGVYDGIQRVLFGGGLRFWLHKLLFLDSLSYLSHGQLSVSLQRFLLVDVDDIFVGEKGTRLRKDDVMVRARDFGTRMLSACCRCHAGA